MNSKISLIIWFKKYCGILACVHILGYRIQDTDYRIQDAGFRIQNTEYRIQDAGFRIQNTEYRIPDTV